MSVAGFRVEGSDGGHRLRLQKAEAILPGDNATLFERLEDARLSRNQASYAAAPVPPPDADTAAVAVEGLIKVAEAWVRPQLPEWLSES